MKINFNFFASFFLFSSSFLKRNVKINFILKFTVAGNQELKISVSETFFVDSPVYLVDIPVYLVDSPVYLLDRTVYLVDIP